MHPYHTWSWRVWLSGEACASAGLALQHPCTHGEGPGQYSNELTENAANLEIKLLDLLTSSCEPLPKLPPVDASLPELHCAPALCWLLQAAELGCGLAGVPKIHAC